MINNLEIERKFLLNKLPTDYKNYELKNIEQAYISLSNPEHRIRKKNNKYLETYKGNGNLSRTEDEKEISVVEYNKLLNSIVSRIIYKKRYMIPLENNLIAELNIFEKELKGIFLIEVEFNSIEEANKFIAPSWFGLEVTENNKFMNKYLATCSTEEIKNIINEYFIGVDL